MPYTKHSWLFLLFFLLGEKRADETSVIHFNCFFYIMLSEKVRFIVDFSHTVFIDFSGFLTREWLEIAQIWFLHNVQHKKVLPKSSSSWCLTLCRNQIWAIFDHSRDKAGKKNLENSSNFDFFYTFSLFFLTSDDRYTYRCTKVVPHSLDPIAPS